MSTQSKGTTRGVIALLELDAISKRYGAVRAVDGVSFSVDRGEVVGFLGPNGAGKSTTMRMITQYIEPDGGSIRFDGQILDDAALLAKRRIGYLPESNPLYDDMLVAEYLSFIADLRGLGRTARGPGLDDAVTSTGIGDVYHRPIAELSKGYRQRVGLAQAILHRPDLLVLDEPTEGLDPNQRVEIRRLIGELGKERTVILSTHVLPEAQSVCSRLVVIHRGRIVADGPADQLVEAARGSSRIAVEVTGSGVADAVRALPGVYEVEERGAKVGGRVSLSLVTDGSEDVRPRVFELAKSKGWTLYELHQQTRSLEELFRELTGDGGAA